jgi:DUF4097 and DUF4098 domain-containing protein YvlB
MRGDLWIRVSLVAGLAVTVAAADEWSKRYTVSGKAELRVDTNDGSVNVRTWDRNEIEARVTTSGYRIAPSDVQVIDRQAGNRVEIEVRQPRRPFSVNFGHRWIRVELNVPRELRSNIHTGDGNISMDGVHGETQLNTGDGRIEAEALDGALDAQTGDGRIRVRGRFDALRLHTGDGSIEADIDRGSKVGAEWNVRTGDGHVTLRIADNLAADLDVHTGDGHITSDLTVTATGAFRDHDLRGKINGGGPPFIIRTNDGSVRLEKL